jgi:hypothetical protein
LLLAKNSAQHTPKIFSEKKIKKEEGEEEEEEEEEK